MRDYCTKNLKKYVRWYGIIIMHYISAKLSSTINDEYREGIGDIT